MFWRRKREADLERELRAHLDLEAEELQNRDAARRALGNVARIKEDVREAWGWTADRKIRSGFEVRAAADASQSRILADRRAHAGSGSGRHHGDVFHRARRPSEAAAISPAGPPVCSAHTSACPRESGQNFPVNWMWFEQWHRILPPLRWALAWSNLWI